MLKAYKYRLYPTIEQQVLLNKHFGCVRFVYNWALETKNKAYVENKQNLNCSDLSSKLPSLKEEYPWLKEVSAQSLQTSLRRLDNAFTNFFRRFKDGSNESGFPKMKTKKNHRSFQSYQKFKVDVDNGFISVLKIPNIKTVFHRKFCGKINSLTISQSKSGKYFVSILIDNGEAPLKPKNILEAETIGIDLGLKDFAILSNGEKISNPRFNKKILKKKARLNRKMDKQYKMNGKKHTRNREKTRIKLAKLYEKVENRKRDWLHNLSSRLVRENQTICIEDLNVAGMMQNHKLAASIQDVSWSEFTRQLEYKCLWYSKNLVCIGRFEPSSKTCSVCGHVKKDLHLSNREWTCDVCGTRHDRDVNAAVNIKQLALHPQNLLREKKKINTAAQAGIHAWGDQGL